MSWSGSLAELLERGWGVAGAVSRLGGENENHLVTTPDGDRFVLKIAPAEAARREFALEAAAVSALQSRDLGLSLPTVVPTRGGGEGQLLRSADGQERLARLMTYVDGAPWGEAGDPSPARLRNAGRTVASITDTLAALDLPEARRTHRWDLTRADALRPGTRWVRDSSRRRVLKEAFRLWAGAAPFLRDLPLGLIHGDLNDENVLVRDEGIGGVLDFGDALINPLLCELAIALAYLTLRAEDPLRAGAHLVGGYHGIAPLSALECELLFPLMCGRLAVSVSIAAERRSVEPKRASWFVTESGAWAALERFVEIDPTDAADVLTSVIDVEPWDDRGAPPEQLVQRRRERLSPALSLSFRSPLKVVRGRGTYLYDERGRP